MDIYEGKRNLSTHKRQHPKRGEKRSKWEVHPVGRVTATVA